MPGKLKGVNGENPEGRQGRLVGSIKECSLAAKRRGPTKGRTGSEKMLSQGRNS